MEWRNLTARPPFIAALALSVLVGGFVAASRSGYLAQPQNEDLVGAVLPGAVISLTNGERRDEGLPTLKANELLNRAAQLKANDMAAKSYYAHVSPDGTPPPYWLTRVGYKYSIMGENLVVDRENSQAVVSAWMGSQYHRENILNPQFTEIGIGVAEGNYKDRDTIYVVQMLARPQQVTAVVPTVRPKPVQVRPQPTTPVPVRTAATTTVLVRPPEPKPVIRDEVRPVLEAIASSTLVEVPAIIASTTLSPLVLQPYVEPPGEPVDLVGEVLPEPPPAVRSKVRAFMSTMGQNIRSFFSPIF